MFRPILWGLAAAVLVGCSTPSPTKYQGPVSFDDWRAAHESDVSAFEAYLRMEALDQLVPLRQLLRTASSWRECNASPFEVLPEPQWADAASVLRLMRDLQDRGLLGEFEVHSTYRNPTVNACVGGAARSAHTLAFAVDFTPRSPQNAVDLICGFWREQGRELRMGLGRYPSGRLHIDAYGYRSWGSDGTWRTALCPGSVPSFATRMP